MLLLRRASRAVEGGPSERQQKGQGCSQGDPDNLLLEGTNATDKANTPKVRSPRPVRAKDYLDRFFTKGMPISGSRLPFASSHRRHRNQSRTTWLRLW